MAWLLEGDPAVRWQVLRDLEDAPEEVVAGERARVAVDGWGPQLLALQAADGRWGGGTYFPSWTSTAWTLALLRQFGLDPRSEPARRAVVRVREKVKWEYDELPFFGGEVEPCINGLAVALGAYYGQDVRVIVDRLLGEQMSDGGWNCEQERGSTRGSFHTTICVLEGLLEHERATGGTPEMTAALLKGQEYLVERRLLHRLSTGEVINPVWTQFSFPTYYFYDVLRALDYLRSADAVPDERLTEAVALIENKRTDDGRWLLENPHEGKVHLDLEESEGNPSRWNTLRALRVLRWYAQAPW